MKLAALALPLLGLPHLASAETVTLDLYGDEFVQSPANEGLQGFFPDAGFLVTAESNESAFGGLYDLRRIGDGNTGADVGVNRLVFSPQSGATFDLEMVSISGFYTGIYAEYSARDTAGFGPDEFLSDAIPLLDEDAYLQGFKPDGEVVVSRFLPYDFSDFDELTSPNASFRGAFPSNDDPIFDEADFGPGFEGLVALEVSTGQGLFGAFPPSSPPAECRPYNLARVDPRFALSGFCTGTPFPGNTLEDIEVRVEQLGSRNDAGFIDLDGITVSLNDPAPSTVAPVPVPAALPMLGARLALLAAGGLRRQAVRVGQR